MKFQMLIRFILLFFCLSMMIASAKADMQKGIEWYQNRHMGSTGITASEESINKAIACFSSEIQKVESEKVAALYLLKSYYYKAEFAISTNDDKKKIFNMGKILGEKFIEKYPDSPAIRYWYLVNLGSWAQVYGILTAAREGVADLMKIHSEIIIELDPKYQDGGGYFMLGAVHYKSPYIPFLLSWPDNDEAIKYLQLALNTGEATLNQKVYLAKSIKKDGQINNAKKLLEEVINSKPDSTNLIEELDDIDEALQLLKDF